MTSDDKSNPPVPPHTPPVAVTRVLLVPPAPPDPLATFVMRSDSPPTYDPRRSDPDDEDDEIGQPDQPKADDDKGVGKADHSGER